MTEERPFDLTTRPLTADLIRQLNDASDALTRARSLVTRLQVLPLEDRAEAERCLDSLRHEADCVEEYACSLGGTAARMAEYARDHPREVDRHVNRLDADGKIVTDHVTWTNGSDWR